MYNLIYSDTFDVYDQIDTVEYRARQSSLISCNGTRFTNSVTHFVSEVTARTRVLGGNEHEISWIGSATGGSYDRDDTVFERLA